MFAVKCLIMIKTAITGSEKFLQPYVHTIRNKPEFSITGIHCNEYPSAFYKYSNAYSLHTTFSDKLYDVSDALIVTDKAGEYFDIICRFLKRAKHVLILPDITLTIQQLKKLIKIAEEAGVILNLHHNTLNSAIKQKIREFIIRPEYIFLKSQIIEKKTEKNYCIFDALYRYIYLLFEFNPVNIVKYHVTGVPVYSTEPSILDINLQFENGTTAHLNISTCFKEESEKLEIFGHDKMISFEPIRNELLMIQSHPDEIKRKRCEGFKIQGNEDALWKFYRSIHNMNGSENRISSGIISHQVASGILHQIHPASIEE